MGLCVPALSYYNQLQTSLREPRYLTNNFQSHRSRVFLFDKFKLWTTPEVRSRRLCHVPVLARAASHCNAIQRGHSTVDSPQPGHKVTRDYLAMPTFIVTREPLSDSEELTNPQSKAALLRAFVVLSRDEWHLTAPGEPAPQHFVHGPTTLIDFGAQLGRTRLPNASGSPPRTFSPPN